MDSMMRDKMPTSLQEIADVIGDNDAMKLVQTYGGTRVFVPQKLKAQHKLALLLGMAQAQKLRDMFGGETLAIARCVKWRTYQRNEEMRKKYDEGIKIGELVREYGITERQVYAIMSSVS